MSEKLKPCPFCGGAAELYAPEHYGAPREVMCDCGARGALSYSKAEAIAAWNRRAGDE